MCPPDVARAGSIAGLGKRGEGVDDGAEKPAQPDALALALLADPVHAVIPVAGAHQGQAVRADWRGSVDGPRAMLVQRAPTRRPDSGSK